MRGAFFFVKSFVDPTDSYFVKNLMGQIHHIFKIGFFLDKFKGV